MKTKAERAAYKHAWYVAHRQLTIRRSRKWREANRARYNGYFSDYYATRRAMFYSGPCVECGGREDLHLHHRDPSSKRFNIASNLGRPLAALKTEVQKCDLLCAPCHMKRHAQLRRAA